jgi:Na+/proline symporter
MNEPSNKLTKDKISFNKTDLVVIFTHLTIGLLIWVTYQQELIDKEIIKSFASGYIFLAPLILIGLFFRKLRKIGFYLIWVSIALLQILIYLYVKDNSDFFFKRGTAFDGLIALLPTLILFQIFRQIFYSFKGQEMIISIRHYRMTWYEKEDRRNMTWLEVVFSILLMLTATLSSVFLT